MKTVSIGNFIFVCFFGLSFKTGHLISSGQAVERRTRKTLPALSGDRTEMLFRNKQKWKNKIAHETEIHLIAIYLDGIRSKTVIVNCVNSNARQPPNGSTNIDRIVRRRFAIIVSMLPTTELNGTTLDWSIEIESDLCVCTAWSWETESIQGIRREQNKVQYKKIRHIFSTRTKLNNENWILICIFYL